MKKKRIIYAILTLAIFLIEVLIALFVHDSFIRPYFGDVLVVILLYTFIRIFIPEGCRLLSLYIFIFAVLVEFSQMIHFVDLIGLGNIRFFRVLMGTSFAVEDIFCYAAGNIVTGLYELWDYKRSRKEDVC